MDRWDYKELADTVGQRIIPADIKPPNRASTELYDAEEQILCSDIIALGLYEQDLEHVVIYRRFVGHQDEINVAYAAQFLECHYRSLGKFLDEPQHINNKYIHIKTNKEYVLLHEGTFHKSPGVRQQVAIYQEVDPKPESTIWVRNLSIFHDGRFKRIT